MVRFEKIYFIRFVIYVSRYKDQSYLPYVPHGTKTFQMTTKVVPIANRGYFDSGENIKNYVQKSISPGLQRPI